MAETKSTNDYIVQRPIKHHKATLPAGKIIALTDDEAGHLLVTGAITADKTVPAKAAR